MYSNVFQNLIVKQLISDILNVYNVLQGANYIQQIFNQF